MHSSTDLALDADDVDTIGAFLDTLADRAAETVLPFYRQPMTVENKLAEGYDPVTEADRACERALRDAIAAAWPEAGVVGEEYGAVDEDARDVWVLDPIDGTRAFVAGIPVWMTLAGLRREGRAVAGLACQPFTDERFFGLRPGRDADGRDRDGRAWTVRGRARQSLATRGTHALADAYAMTTSPELLTPAMRSLLGEARHTRYGADAYAFCMLAAGQVDLAVECGVQSYDVTALIPIVEGAGGVMTAADGGPAEAGGDVVAAATPELHAAALARLAAS